MDLDRWAAVRPRWRTFSFCTELVDKSLADLRFIIDSHMHIVGMESAKTGCWVPPKMFSITSPQNFSRRMYASCCVGVSSGSDNIDRIAADRLIALVNGIPGKRYYGLAFAFAQTYVGGKADLEHTGLYIPNSYMMDVVSRSPHLVPDGSVHPYQPVHRLRW